MAQEAGGLVNYSQNPSGVGSVYFGAPVDLLAQQERQGDDLARAIQYSEQKKLTKRKIASDMVGDLKVDFNGIMDTDAPYFKQKASELAGLYAQAIQSGQDPSNPAFTEANTKFQSAMNGLMAEVNGSKAQKVLLQDVAVKYDPNKHDDSTLQKMGDFRLATPTERQKINLGLIPKKESYLEMVAPIAKDIKPEIENTLLKGGILGEQKTTTYLPDEKIVSIVDATPTMVEKAWRDAPQGRQDKYLAQQLTNGVVDQDLAVEKAKKQMAIDDLKTLQAVQNDIQIHGETEAQKQGVKLSAKAKEGSVLPITVSTFATGDPKFNKVFPYNIGAATFFDGTPIPANLINTPVYGTQSFNTPIGTFKGVTRIKDEKGVFDKPDGEAQPNAIEVAVHGKDGKLMVQTTESRRNYLNKIGNTPFLFFNSPAELMQYAGMKLKASGDQTATDVLSSANLFLQQTNNGSISGFDPFKVHPLTKQEQEQRGANMKAAGLVTEEAPKQTAKPAAKQIKVADIPARAKAAGYTDAEYRKLLIDKGIQIIQ